MRSRAGAVIFWAVWGSAAFFILSSPAYAWGPGTHVECSRFLLEHLVLLAPVVRKLLRAYPFEFIYGSVCPDMVLAKRLMRPEHNNHNWAIGFDILDSAGSPPEQAFALGYLSHLAADTVAHNLFIPNRILRQFDRRRRGHMVQELIFDAMLDDEVWSIARATAQKQFPDCNSLVNKIVTRTPLPKRVNQGFFQGGLLLVRMGWWQLVVRRLGERWEKELEQLATTDYLDDVHNTALEFLSNPESASCLDHSPAGEAILPNATRLRKTLRRMNRKDGLHPDQYCDLVSSFSQWRDQELFMGDSDRTTTP